MNHENEGGCAFPIFTDYGNHVYNDAGMSLRDYFAAKAMQGILSGWNSNNEGNSVFKPKAVSNRAYVMADAMLEARK